MPIKKKSDLDGIQNLTAEDKADLVALFDSVETSNSRINDLTKKQADADEVMKKVPELEKLIKTRDSQNAELQDKLKKYTEAPEPVETETSGPFGFMEEFADQFLSDDDTEKS